MCSMLLEIRTSALCHWLYFLMCSMPLPLPSLVSCRLPPSGPHDSGRETETSAGRAPRGRAPGRRECRPQAPPPPPCRPRDHTGRDEMGTTPRDGSPPPLFSSALSSPPIDATATCQSKTRAPRVSRRSNAHPSPFTVPALSPEEHAGWMAIAGLPLPNFGKSWQVREEVVVVAHHGGHVVRRTDHLVGVRMESERRERDVAVGVGGRGNS
jgi:hypothetical protein